MINNFSVNQLDNLDASLESMLQNVSNPATICKSNMMIFQLYDVNVKIFNGFRFL